MENDTKWLDWAKELQFIAQSALAYTENEFDRERFMRVREIAAEIVSHQTGLPPARVRDLFCNETGYQTPKLDTRAAIFDDGKILLVREKTGLWRSMRRTALRSAAGLRGWTGLTARIRSA